MMNEDKRDIKVDIMGKQYPIKCPGNKIQELQDAAAIVDQQMRKIRSSGKVTGTDKIAIIAALNIAYLLLENKNRDDLAVAEITDRLANIKDKIAATL